MINRKYLVLIVITTMLCAGCSVQGYTVTNAMKACAAHGGIHEIHIDVSSQHVICNDGIHVRYVNEAKND